MAIIIVNCKWLFRVFLTGILVAVMISPAKLMGKKPFKRVSLSFKEDENE
jgi:hypothetical protein